jgi:hypothetical protein
MNKQQIVKAQGLVSYKQYRGTELVPTRVLTTETLYVARYGSGFGEVRYCETSATRCSETLRDITGYLCITVNTHYTSADEQAEAAKFVNSFTGNIGDLIKYGRRIEGALPKGVTLTVHSSRDLAAR